MSCSWIRRLNIVSIHSPQIDLKNILVVFFVESDRFFFNVCENAKSLEYPK